jgi:hypothetical protein
LPPSVRGQETTAYDRETLDRLRLQDEPPPPTTVNPSLLESSRPPVHEPAPVTAPQPPRDLRPATGFAPDLRPATPLPPTSLVATPAPRTSRGPLTPPPDRAALLDRLRERARSLPPSRVTQILARGAGD